MLQRRPIFSPTRPFDPRPPRRIADRIRAVDCHPQSPSTRQSPPRPSQSPAMVSLNVMKARSIAPIYLAEATRTERVSAAMYRPIGAATRFEGPYLSSCILLILRTVEPVNEFCFMPPFHFAQCMDPAGQRASIAARRTSYATSNVVTRARSSKAHSCRPVPMRRLPSAAAAIASVTAFGARKQPNTLNVKVESCDSGDVAAQGQARCLAI
jgi:hypothetical protein